MSSLADWLREHRLEKYADAFAEHAIDLDILPQLTADDLKELDIPFGDRKRILQAAATLQNEVPATPERSEAVAAAATGAELRQVTVMFCDLVGSTALSERMGPEAYSRLIVQFRDAVAKAIKHYDGYVGRYVGDALLVCFGYPRAHEDDSERAIRAGLDAIEHVRRLAGVDVELQVRIGVATGVVVAGDIRGEGAAENDGVLGDTPNLAARLQTLAAPGSIVISHDTRQLAADLFVYEDLGRHGLKGFKDPVQAWRVVSVTAPESRFDAVRGGHATPLVGREQELALLLDHWARAKHGSGRAVLLTGEAGIGKSRLVQALKQQVSTEPHVRLLYQCSPHFTHSALYPVIMQLERACRFQPGDSADMKLDKLVASVAQIGAPAEQTVALLAALLSIPGEGRLAPLAMDAKQQRARTMEVLIEQVRNMAAQAPVLILFEDAHWSDPTSLELLGRFIDTLTNLSALLVLTARPEFQSPWAASDQVTNLALNRLTRAQSAAIVQALITDCDLPPPVVERMLDTTDGVPLFVEEMTKAVLESAAQSRPDPKRAASSAYDSLSVPATLRDSLMARLDRLGTAREVAEIGAALGREFSYELCWAVTAFDELKLRAALAEIVASELLLQRGQPRQASYTFKHALVQEVAYGTMLQDKRRKLHLTIAHVLKEQFPSVIEARPEVLARHYAEAGAVDSAVKYFGQAGRLAAARSANLEAIAHLERALELLRALPENAGRHERELALLTMLAGALIASTGYTTPQLNAVLTRAMELAAEGGDPVPLFPILHGRYLFLSVSGQTRKAFELAERLFRLAQAHAPRTAQMTSHRVLGNSLYLMGELARARGHLESALAMYVPEEHAPLAIQLGQDARVAALSVLALTRWQLGEAAGALELEQTAVELAERLKHANSLSYALAHGALLHGVAGDHSNQKLRAEALFEVASVADLPVWKAASLFLRGWAVAGLGDLKPGLMLMQEGDAILSKIGVRYWRPVILTELGRFLARFGDTAAALAKLEEAEAIAREGGEIWFNGECFRVAAELGLMAGRTDVQETERAFDRALVAARSTGSKSFELRTAVSLAHFWHTQDRHRDAHDLLAQVCRTVGEGANIPDLQQARMLMEERARQC